MAQAFVRLSYRTNSNLKQQSWIKRVVARLMGYTRLGEYARAQIFRRIIRQLSFENWQRVLDLGCGQGTYSLLLADLVPDIQVVALDIDPVACDKLANNIDGTRFEEQIQIQCQPVGQLPSAAVFDFIFANNTFSYIPEADMPFQEVYDRLLPGGYFLIRMSNKTQRTVLPRKWFAEAEARAAQRLPGRVFDLPDLEDRMEACGFEIVDSRRTDGLVARFAWEIAWLSRRKSLVLYLLVLPVAKLLIHIGLRARLTQKGNAIYVLGQKTY